MGLFTAKQDRVKPDPDGPHSGWQLTIHLTLAGGVALLCATLALLQHSGAARTRETARAIALSGTQEMLIQRIALFSGTLMTAPAPGVETELALAVATFDQNHHILSELADGHAGPTHVYFESGAVSVQAQSKRLVSLTHDILDTPTATSLPALREVRHMASATFQGQAAAATAAFSQVARNQTRILTFWQTLLSALVVLVMTAETAFVIWPARKALSRAARHRRRLNDALDVVQKEQDQVRAESRQISARYAHAMRHDALTGLLNRSQLSRHLTQLGIDPQPTGKHLSVICADLDQFRAVNESFGHETGDAILRQAADRLREAAPDQAALARSDGNGFVVAGWFEGEDPLAQTAQSIAEAFDTEFEVGERSHRLTVSLGTALTADLVTGAERVISDAEIALHRVKQTNRGHIRAFEPRMRTEFESRQALISDLRGAVEEKAFEAFFQPLLNLADGSVAGFEMLARWHHPDHGLLMPESFLGLARDAGLDNAIDQVVLANGLDALVRLRAAGWTIPFVAINASARSLDSESFAEVLKHEVECRNLTPADLAVEVSETRLREVDLEAAKDALERLSWAGFPTYLDDFGTGFAALSSLSSLPLRGVKVDRSLVSTLPDKGSEAVLRALVGLAHDLDLTVTAEGVEAPTQFAPLAELGCDLAQGFGIAKPHSEADTAAWLTARDRRDDDGARTAISA